MKNDKLGYVMLVLFLCITSIFSLKLFLQQRKAYDKLDIHAFPYQVGQWQGKDLEITEREYEILETRNLISREYTNSRQETISLFIIYSETNRAVFHPPEVCLLGSGVTIVDKQVEEIDSGKDKFSANKLYTQKDDYRGLSLYCYKAGNFYTHNFYLQQIKFALNQLLGGRRGGATIRVSMPITHTEEKTLKTMKAFMVEAVEIINFLS